VGVIVAVAVGLGEGVAAISTVGVWLTLGAVPLLQAVSSTAKISRINILFIMP
jgi:hypothetical protein